MIPLTAPSNNSFSFVFAPRISRGSSPSARSVVASRRHQVRVNIVARVGDLPDPLQLSDLRLAGRVRVEPCGLVERDELLPVGHQLSLKFQLGTEPGEPCSPRIREAHDLGEIVPMCLRRGISRGWKQSQVPRTCSTSG